MTYKELQIDMANRGYINTPITKREYNLLNRKGLNSADIVGVALDVGCGYSIKELLEFVITKRIKQNGI